MNIEQEKNKIQIELNNLQIQLTQIDTTRQQVAVEMLKRVGMLELLTRLEQETKEKL